MEEGWDEHSYKTIQNSILEAVRQAGKIPMTDVLAILREHGISREVGSTIILESIGAGYIHRTFDFVLTATKGRHD